MKIFKYKVEIKSEFIIEMPEGSEVLCVEVQRDAPYIWVMCDSSRRKEMRIFGVKATGQDFGDADRTDYIGSFLLDGGSFVGHLFEVR